MAERTTKSEVLIKDIEEYRRNPNALRAELYINGFRQNEQYEGAGEEDLTLLEKETKELIALNTKTGISKDGMVLGRTHHTKKFGGIETVEEKREVYVGPGDVTAITGVDNLSSVHMVHNPGFIDLNYDARLEISRKGTESLVFAFEGGRVSRVREVLNDERAPAGFGFRFTGPVQEAIRSELTLQDRQLVRNVLRGINSRLRRG